MKETNYKVVRFFYDDTPRETVQVNLTREEAKGVSSASGNGTVVSAGGVKFGRGEWFDGIDPMTGEEELTLLGDIDNVR